ncbi:MAG: ATP-binding cassette domain-containing protein [Verrucomicrobia bacterium]|nr:ATP-binding cassette domain-containing protein [Verrucomicrobiota bacterium]
MSEGTKPIVEVVELRKEYPGHTAVNGVSFTIPRGGIVGLLGPNGAGKSTILKILSCYMPATSGSVRVGGFDVFREAHQVRKRIGYMPETNPLHLDMRVRDYLKFRARLKGLDSARARDRIATVMDGCGLIDVSRRIIGQLSKGYRQRVGLADAIVCEPDLIILDEPTVGLDPNQIRSVRELILSLAGNHTVLLSTHILSEVELVCGHIIILHEGKVLAADTKDNLLASAASDPRVCAEIQARPDALHDCWTEMDSIDDFDLSPIDNGFVRCTLAPSSGADLRPLVFETARGKGWPVRELTRSRNTLEEVFIQMIRKDLGGQP